MEPHSYIVNLWARVFQALRWVSVFQYIRLIPKLKQSYLFVEVWVVMNLIIGIVSTLIAYYSALPSIVSWILLIYSFIRVTEIIVYQVNVLLFDPYRNLGFSVRSYRRSVILLIHNYMELIFWFASSYTILSKTLDLGMRFHGVGDIILFSFLTMVTFGSSSVKEIVHIGHAIIFVQAIIGLFMTIVSFARFVGLLPKPASQEIIEKEEEQKHQELKNQISLLQRKIDLLEKLVKKQGKEKQKTVI
ncbi:hypothetical protein ACQCN2_09860 [Brevibacillus ginsengisoli]|uniref:hypothetical protein n=1 Tax=Brevibacillus ginsengisoli TaxID=363854 RepID=UPI003CEE9157